MKKNIAAYEFRHAEYYAQQVLHIRRDQWRFISDVDQIRGYRGSELILIHAPRFKPSSNQLYFRAMLLEFCAACEIVVKRVELP